MLFIQVFIIVILIGIFVQDLKSRAVYWFWFPALLGLLLTLKFREQRLSDIFDTSVINLGFVLFQFFFVSLYFSTKHKRFINITKTLLGWGDILFLLTTAFYFSTLNYILFYILSLVVVIAVWTPLILSKKKYQQIPLAGLQSLIFIVCLITDWLSPRIDLLHDDWLIRYLY